ncbi:MAG: type II toxin-antitoxin system MqsA family antitoxin [Chloroflexota bacterium]|nr:MAG: type II toxin-antitoxin system MqsA family antitoxin [Chloroflexota bacterium]
MKCVICKHGETQPGKVTVTLQRDGTVVIIKDVPADVCDNCDEYYLSESVLRDLEERVGQAVARGAEVEILRFAA